MRTRLPHVAAALSALWLTAGAFAASTVPRLWPMAIPEKVGPVPTAPVKFYQWVIANRTEDLLRILRTAKDHSRYRLEHSDGYVAWIMATAYQGEGWSRYYRDDEVRALALRLLDGMCEARMKAPFEQGKGHGPKFGLYGLANAVALWKETGAVPPEQIERWVAAVRKTAEFGMRYNARSRLVGEYANPEMYYMAGLAAAWQLTRDERYRREAAATLRRYDDDTFPDGGVAYFRGTNAKLGYQQMVVAAVCRYYEITADPHAKALLECYARYYPLIYNAAGIFSPSEHPWLKHYVSEYVNPGSPGMLASLTGDGRNRTVERIAAYRAAQEVAGKRPSFMTDQSVHAWYNHHHTIFACLALRYQRPVEPKPLVDRWVGLDESVRGIRSRWGDWHAVVTSRRHSVTLPGCLIADAREPFYPLHSGLLFFACDSAGKTIDRPEGFHIDRHQHIMSQWHPAHHRTHMGQGAAVSVLSNLNTAHWGQFPISTAETLHGDPGPWEYIQTWIAWKNSLIGLVRMDALADPPEPGQEGYVRIRPVFIPQNRPLTASAKGDGIAGSYGRLAFAMQPLALNRGWSFGEIDNWSIKPYVANHGGTYVYVHPTSPVYQKDGGTWRRGDRMLLWAAFWDRDDPAIRPEDPEHFQVLFLRDRAALVVVRDDADTVMVFANALNRRSVEVQLNPRPGWTATLRRGAHLLPTFPGEPVRFHLMGAQVAQLRVDSAKPLAASDVAKQIEVTGGRYWRSKPWPLRY